MIATDNQKTGVTYFKRGVTVKAATLCEVPLYYKGDPFKGNALIREVQGGASFKGATYIYKNFPNKGPSLIRPTFLNKEIKLEWPDLVGCLT
ncbi:MAG: hypothetical protein AB2817_09495 [Candidatus Thiodiazotropha sp.]